MMYGTTTQSRTWMSTWWRDISGLLVIRLNCWALCILQTVDSWTQTRTGNIYSWNTFFFADALQWRLHEDSMAPARGVRTPPPPCSTATELHWNKWLSNCSLFIYTVSLFPMQQWQPHHPPPYHPLLYLPLPSLPPRHLPPLHPPLPHLPVRLYYRAVLDCGNRNCVLIIWALLIIKAHKIVWKVFLDNFYGFCLLHAVPTRGSTDYIRR